MLSRVALCLGLAGCDKVLGLDEPGLDASTIDADIDAAPTCTGPELCYLASDENGAAELVTDHQLVAHHHVVLDPAYVHITQASLAETARLRAELARNGVHTVGRYGGWTYCSIEDNLIETRALAQRL